MARRRAIPRHFKRLIHIEQATTNASQLTNIPSVGKLAPLEVSGTPSPVLTSAGWLAPAANFAHDEAISGMDWTVPVRLAGIPFIVGRDRGIDRSTRSLFP
jgi:hypothetical protein